MGRKVCTPQSMSWDRETTAHPQHPGRYCERRPYVPSLLGLRHPGLALLQASPLARQVTSSSACMPSA